MHSPETLAFEIRIGRREKKDGNYRTPILSIWHVDPEKNGDDDSCGWFIRQRHVDQTILEKVRKEFKFNHEYWFDKEGKQIFSTIGTLMEMYRTTAWIHFKQDRKKMDAFFQKHCANIIHFAENPHDCGGDNITGKFYLSNGSDLLDPYRFAGFAGMVYTDILRKERKWYQHPKWHVNHWRFQFPMLQQLKRSWWTKCCKCGKRGFKSSAMRDWNNTKIWHQECDESAKSISNGSK